mmetsp:Transcript_34735/g.98595  ORF Transcript_34735/g.98595 Transcript_34735/m.98595 type:complete len:392 (+) Transcript_34735:54-1229(+)
MHSMFGLAARANSRAEPGVRDVLAVMNPFEDQARHDRCNSAATACHGVDACGNDEPSPEVMTYMGKGFGEYVQELSYHYVGNGAGEFDVLDPRARSPRLGVVGLGCVGVGVAALVVFAFAIARPAPGTTTSVVRSALASSQLGTYNCDLGPDDRWSIAEHRYCCRERRIGCQRPPTTMSPDDLRRAASGEPMPSPSPSPSPVAPSPLAPSPLSSPPRLPAPWLTPNPKELEEADEKTKESTTTTTLLAAPSAMPTPMPNLGASYYDCAAGIATWIADWSISKQAWCCEKEGQGCALGMPLNPPRTPAPIPAEYDCMQGFASWVSDWSPEKRSWCCLHETRACLTLAPMAAIATTMQPDAFACDEGAERWEAAWSLDKKAWCCAHQRKGCIA